jgi:hypothetical protein
VAKLLNYIIAMVEYALCYLHGMEVTQCTFHDYNLRPKYLTKAIMTIVHLKTISPHKAIQGFKTI